MNQSIVLDTPDQIHGLALISAVHSMKIWVKSGGRMRSCRLGTPAYLAQRFNLIDPKTKRAPKTAKACLRLLEAMKAAHDKKLGIDPQSMVTRAQPRYADVVNVPPTLN